MDMRTSKSQPELGDAPDRILAWRIERLRSSGFSVRLADSLARDRRYDLHSLLDLIDRGCPAELAARIVAPIEDIEDEPARC